MSPVPGMVMTPLPPLGAPYDAREAALIAYARDRMLAGRVIVVRHGSDGSINHVERSGDGTYSLVWIAKGMVTKTAPLTADEARWIVRTALRMGVTIPTEPPIGKETELDRVLASS